MSNTASELANGLHFLRLCELDFEILLLGDIDEMEGEPLPRFIPGVGILRARIGAKRPIPRIVEAADSRPTQT